MDVQKEQEQQNRTDHVVSGFAFYSEKDARLAEQERQKIAYLDKRIDRTNLESVLVIYKKALDDRVFRTPVGLEYLRELQGELKAEQDLLGEEIPPIPLWTNFADTREKTSPARRRIKPAPEENKKYDVPAVSYYEYCDGHCNYCNVYHHAEFRSAQCPEL